MFHLAVILIFLSIGLGCTLEHKRLPTSAATPDISLQACLKERPNICRIFVRQRAEISGLTDQLTIALTFRDREVFVSDAFRIIPFKSGALILAKGQWKVNKKAQRLLIHKKPPLDLTVISAESNGKIRPKLGTRT